MITLRCTGIHTQHTPKQIAYLWDNERIMMAYHLMLDSESNQQVIWVYIYGIVSDPMKAVVTFVDDITNKTYYTEKVGGPYSLGIPSWEQFTENPEGYILRAML